MHKAAHNRLTKTLAHAADGESIPTRAGFLASSVSSGHRVLVSASGGAVWSVARDFEHDAVGVQEVGGVGVLTLLRKGPRLVDDLRATSDSPLVCLLDHGPGGKAERQVLQPDAVT
jgi:hypothetical protein